MGSGKAVARYLGTAPARRCPASQHIGANPALRVPADGRRARGLGPMSTRTLLILAALTGVAILTAGAVQILLAR